MENDSEFSDEEIDKIYHTFKSKFHHQDDKEHHPVQEEQKLDPLDLPFDDSDTTYIFTDDDE